MEVMVEIAGNQRTWREESFTISECLCGSRAFKRSKLSRHWYCKGCNERYEEKPWFPVMTCSQHGRQLRYHDNDDYWCTLCEHEAWQYAARHGLLENIWTTEGYWDDHR